MVESVLKGRYEVPDDRDRCSGDEPGRDPRLCGFFPVEGEGEDGEEIGLDCYLGGLLHLRYSPSSLEKM